TEALCPQIEKRSHPSFDMFASKVIGSGPLRDDEKRRGHEQTPPVLRIGFHLQTNLPEQPRRMGAHHRRKAMEMVIMELHVSKTASQKLLLQQQRVVSP